MELYKYLELIGERRERKKIQGECDSEMICRQLGLSIGELVWTLIVLLWESEREAVKFKDKYYQVQRRNEYLEETTKRVLGNGGQLQKELVKSGMPIAKKKCDPAGLALLIKTGSTDKELMEHYGISRTTLWRWKKQSEEWKKKYGFD